MNNVGLTLDMPQPRSQGLSSLPPLVVATETKRLRETTKGVGEERPWERG